MSTKVSISLDDADVAYLDEQVGSRFASRSAAVQEAIRLLRESALADAYAYAFAEGEYAGWDSTTGDGMTAA